MTHSRSEGQNEEKKSSHAQINSAEPQLNGELDGLGLPTLYSPRQNNLLRLQQTIGNRAVLRRMAVQREAEAAVDSDTPVESNEMKQAEYSFTLEMPAAIPIEEVISGLGDYPEPDPNTVMAKRLDGPLTVPSAVVQRDGDAGNAAGNSNTGSSPAGSNAGGSSNAGASNTSADDDNRKRLGIDPQYGYTFPIYTPRGAAAPVPWSFQVTGLWRNLTLPVIGSDPLGLDILHEPGVSLAIDSSQAISAQAGITLLNFHWMPPWKRQLEVGLSGYVNTTLLPQLAVALGGQLQAEQHIVPWFSVTLGVSGNWTPPQNGSPGQFAVTGNTSALVHFNLF